LPRPSSPLSWPRHGAEEGSDEHDGGRKRLAFPIDLPVLLYWGMRENYPDATRDAKMQVLYTHACRLIFASAT
jgi:hypothetical protein